MKSCKKVFNKKKLYQLIWFIRSALNPKKIMLTITRRILNETMIEMERIQTKETKQILNNTVINGIRENWRHLRGDRWIYVQNAKALLHSNNKRLKKQDHLFFIEYTSDLYSRFVDISFCFLKHTPGPCHVFDVCNHTQLFNFLYQYSLNEIMKILCHSKNLYISGISIMTVMKMIWQLFMVN